MSYQVSSAQALESAGRVMKETGACAIKLEGGFEVVETVQRIVNAGIPVMSHIGLTPQSVHALGGYRVQGKTRSEVTELIESAKALEKAGAFALVLELMPPDVSRLVSESISIPTLGIGAGPDCSGQVLVLHDMLGLSSVVHEKQPKFVKTYLDGAAIIQNAIASYVDEVRRGVYPEKEHSYPDAGISLTDEVLQ
jgi:3-methyl-2-oxobutanoate hydroxymethyltransferase